MRIGGILLAAGESRRMGRDKMGLRLGERTVLEASLGNLLEGGLLEVVAVVREGMKAGGDTREDAIVRFVVCKEPELGMLHSIKTGIASYAKDPPEAYLVALGDQPFILPGTIRRVMESFCDSALPICLPSYRGERGHPVIFAHSLVCEVMALSAEVGLRGMIYADCARVLEVPVEDAGIRRDLDTQADYAQVQLAEEAL